MENNNKQPIPKQNKRTSKGNKIMTSGKKKDSVSSKLSIPSTGRLIFIFALVIIAYYPTFFNGFTNWDDNKQVLENADITTLSFHHIKTYFTSFYVGMYQPFATLCFAVIFKFSGLKAHAYHVFSLLLHLINVLLVYKIVRKLTTKAEIIFFVTLFFAVNPMQTEAVAWVSATSTLLYSVFFLLSASVYLNFITNENNKKDYYFSFLFFLFALFSKSAAVTLPLVLLLFDYFVHSTISKKDILNKLPFFVLSLLFGIVTIIGRQEAEHIFDITKYYSYFDRLLFLAYSVSFYIISVFVPFKMSAFHTYPDKLDGLLPVIFYLAPLFLLAIAVLLIKVKRFRKEIMFGIVFFLFCMSVMLELVPVGTQIVKERYSYIACIGLYFGVFIILFEIAKKLKQYLNYILIALSLVFALISHSRTQTWKDSFSLWNDVIKKDLSCAEAYYNRGCEEIIKTDYERAMQDFDKAVARYPDYYDAYYSIGYIKYIQRDYAGAMDDFDKAISLHPAYADAYNIKGLILSRSGKINEGLSNFNKAIEIDPRHNKAYTNRAYARYFLKDYSGAIDDCEKALRIDPNYDNATKIEALAQQELQKEGNH